MDITLSLYQNSTVVSIWSHFEPTSGNQSLRAVSKGFLAKCQTVTERLVEIIQVWHHEEFLFMWSCEELGSGKEHDEAALVLINGKFIGKKDELKVIGPKDLGQSFWGAINRREMSPSEDLGPKSPFLVGCPFEPKMSFAIFLASHKKLFLTALLALAMVMCVIRCVIIHK